MFKLNILILYAKAILSQNSNVKNFVLNICKCHLNMINSFLLLKK